MASNPAYLELTALASDVLSADRFRTWKRNLGRESTLFIRTCAYGEIVWKKTIGRPNSATLSEGFEITAGIDEKFLDYSNGHWLHVYLPRSPVWWDGKDDSEHWRVNFMVPNLRDGRGAMGAPNEITHIVPSLRKEVGWTLAGVPSSPFTPGLREVNPPQVAFVMPDSSVHFTFKVIARLLYTFDHDGIAEL